MTTLKEIESKFEKVKNYGMLKQAYKDLKDELKGIREEMDSLKADRAKIDLEGVKNKRMQLEREYNTLMQGKDLFRD